MLQNTYALEVLWLFVVLLLLMGLGRAVFVFPLSLAHNWWSRERLSLRDSVIIWCVALLPHHLGTLTVQQTLERAPLLLRASSAKLPRRLCKTCEQTFDLCDADLQQLLERQPAAEHA